MSVFVSRRDRLWQTAVRDSLDTLLITQPLNVTYLSGFSGDSGNLLLTKNKTLLVSDGRFKEQLAQECPELDTYIRSPAEPLMTATVDQLTSLGSRAIGFESGHLTVADYEAFKEGMKTADWKGDRDRVEKLRQIKDATEIDAIRHAIAIAETAFEIFRAVIRPADTEKELVDALENYVRRAGGKESAFPPIVAVGARAALPHAPASAQTVQSDRLLLVDWGAQGPFYKSDLTRVLWTRNNVPFSIEQGPPARLREIHAIVLEAQRRAIALMRPGVSSKLVDLAARGYIAERGYGDFFSHGVGHGFGLQIHEAPFFRPNVDVAMEAGMVVTCEPGIYLPGWGGVRIEDDILITPDGPEVLTRCPRELDECELEI